MELCKWHKINKITFNPLNNRIISEKKLSLSNVNKQDVLTTSENKFRKPQLVF